MQPTKPGQPQQTRPQNIRNVELDYKRPETLQRYVNEFGRIRPRRQTRFSAATQRKLAREVKRARHLALLPFVSE